MSRRRFKWKANRLLLLLLCSPSPNDIPPPRTSAERIHSRGTGRRASVQENRLLLKFFPYIANVNGRGKGLS